MYVAFQQLIDSQILATCFICQNLIINPLFQGGALDRVILLSRLKEPIPHCLLKIAERQFLPPNFRDNTFVADCLTEQSQGPCEAY